MSVPKEHSADKCKNMSQKTNCKAQVAKMAKKTEKILLGLIAENSKGWLFGLLALGFNIEGVHGGWGTARNFD